MSSSSALHGERAGRQALSFVTPNPTPKHHPLARLAGRLGRFSRVPQLGCHDGMCVIRYLVATAGPTVASIDVGS